MTVYRPKDRRTFRYDFWFKGVRHLGSTGMTRQKDAEDAEIEIKRTLRLRAAGLLPPAPLPSPSFSSWAEVYYADVLRDPTMARPDRVEHLLRVVLRFWGQPPTATTGKNAAREGEPYHDLTLADPLTDPMWIKRFEDWMAAKSIAGQTKNQYRSTLSQIYESALQPHYRQRSGVTSNPFRHLRRDPNVSRDVTLSADEVRTILTHASYHLRIAIAIAALAPKLRMTNILALQWKQHLDPALGWITVRRHKTSVKTGRPLVVPIVQQLKGILEEVRRRSPGAAYVVSYRGGPIKTVREAVRGAVQASGLTYGRFREEGVTFHTLRHSAATLLAELGEDAKIRQEVMGHTHASTTDRYTHLRPVHQVAAHEHLSAAMPIADLVLQPWRRASRRPAGMTAGPSSEPRDLSKEVDVRPRDGDTVARKVNR